MDNSTEKIVHCIDCLNFDPTGYQADRNGAMYQMGHCNYWRRDTQACRFCSQADERPAVTRASIKDLCDQLRSQNQNAPKGPSAAYMDGFNDALNLIIDAIGLSGINPLDDNESMY